MLAHHIAFTKLIALILHRAFRLAHRIVETGFGAPSFLDYCGIETQTAGCGSRLILITEPSSYRQDSGGLEENIHQIIPTLCALPGLILRPGKIGEIAIGCDAPMMGRNPGKAQIYAVFILHIAPLGKTVAEERIISGRIEPVKSHECEMVGTEIGGCIERGYGTAIARSRFAGEGEAMEMYP